MKLRYLLFLVGFIPFAVKAQLGGSYAYSFLNMPFSARANGLGGNALALPEQDPALSGLYPSRLDSTQHTFLALNYLNYFADINAGSVNYVHDLDSLGTFSAQVRFLNYGTFTRTEANGEIIGEFTAGDYVIGLGYGRKIDSVFAVGANLNWFYSDYLLVRSHGLTIDLNGSYLHPKKRFMAAVLVRNAGVVLKQFQDGYKEKLPFEMQAAVSYKLQHAPFRFHLAAENLQRWDLSFIDPTIQPEIDPSTGEEIPVPEPGFGDKLMRHVVVGTELVTRNFHLGFGYNYRRRKELRFADRGGIAGFSFSTGFKIKKIRIDYALTSFHLAGTSHTLSVAMNLSAFGSKR